MKIDFEKAYDRVRGDFVEDVMKGKGFPDLWISWVMSTIRNGRVCINVNGERSSYFITYRGLRQGDPLSPLLFNLAADALGVMLQTAISKGHIKGVLNVPGGVSHIQYADDTIIMIEASEQYITNLKLILYCFEWLTGLKINYHKSEVFVFGVSQGEKYDMDNMLNCVLVELPMKYLGIPISYKLLNMEAFNPLTQKMIKGLDPWKGKFLTSRGRQVLANSCLSSIPLYSMSFYNIKDGIHSTMDSIRAKFLWQGAHEKFKHHIWPNGRWLAGLKIKVV